jgi:hypothetical protein
MPMSKLATALPALALIALAGCASSGKGRTYELPGGGDAEKAAPTPENRNVFERMIGRDDRPNAGPCPLLGALYEAARVVEFGAPDQERYANIAYTGEIEGVRGLCRYVDENPILETIEINMAFGRGQAAEGQRKTYRYWVAVTRRGRAPIEKKYFDVDVRFRGHDPVVRQTERIERIVIPRASHEVSGENFEILVGFDLTPEQLAFNREGKRFRINAGS